ncbi:aldo/keto reductase [Microbacterium sp. P26]|uniref:aldo/keto reductase n=1 Tax=Microbacterium TaxID=33882 RepID=UPI0020407253|nr:aldo/keto reductase [Microbacterium sp. P26]MCM3501217.1 aldo/keto reductase [Microbacterium sp. P26]
MGLGGARWSLSSARDDEQSVRLIRHAVAQGISLIDTARAYTTSDRSAHNEELIARALRGLGSARDDVMVATKGGHYRRGADFPVDGSPAALRRDCAASAAALGVERLDLYFLHHPDPAVPIEESVGALDELRAEGRVRYVGVSNVTPLLYARASAVARVDAVENEFSPLAAADLRFAASLAQEGVAYLAYSPLGGGRRRTATIPRDFELIAAARGVSTEQIALAWEWAVSPGIIPIIGAGRTATLDDCIDAADVVLSERELAQLTLSVG